MDIGRYVTREVLREIGTRSREFYEFVLPPIDMVEDGNDLVVTIDLPGFAKKDINLRIVGNQLHVNAKRQQDENVGTVYFRHRPLTIDKKIFLPISAKDDEKVMGKATYDNGVLTVRIPIPKSTNITIT
jgi:HSP20 family molecular chaperone IbpA